MVRLRPAFGSGEDWNSYLIVFSYRVTGCARPSGRARSTPRAPCPLVLLKNLARLDLERGVRYCAPETSAVGLCFCLKLYETRRGAILAADLDVQAASVVVNEVHNPKTPGLDAELRDGNEVKGSVRGLRLRYLAFSGYRESRGV